MTNFAHIDKGHLVHNCPGCRQQHVIPVTPESKSKTIWKWNGSEDKPTLSPSILNTWNTVDEGTEIKIVCHYFIVDGFIDFCGDCTHDHAGKKVRLTALKGPGDE